MGKSKGGGVLNDLLKGNMLISTNTTINSTSILYNSKTMNANNTTANVQLFRITGVVRILKLYGIVTTTISSNHTGGFYRLNDQTAQVNITSNSSPAGLSSAAIGTIVSKTSSAATIANVKASSAGGLVELGSSPSTMFAEFLVVAKNGANTDIEYTYTTTNTPASGVILFFVEYQPISSDGSVAAL